MYDMYTWQRPSIFIREKPIFSSERLLHKDYEGNGSVAKKNSGREPQEAWRQDELIDGKPTVVKWLWLFTVEQSHSPVEWE
jgi:hypothetical protein